MFATGGNPSCRLVRDDLLCYHLARKVAVCVPRSSGRILGQMVCVA